MATQPVNSFANTQMARAAAGLYDLQLGERTMTQALAAATQSSVDAVVNAVFNRDFGSMSNADVAALVVKNLGITTTAGLSATAVSDAVAFVTSALNGAAAGNKGAVLVGAFNAFAQLGSHTVYGSVATAFNAQITTATGYASADGTPDVPVHPPATTAFNISTYTAAGANVMRLTGNQDVRLDFGNSNHQITGLDLNGSGTFATTGIAQDGKENNFAYLEANNAVVGANHSGFKIIDAYARNPLNVTDAANNFLGNIYYDGTGFFGDGKASNGNIFLGGLASDIALGGIGNDFFAGGGNSGGGAVTGQNTGDDLSGGRNADFFFVELSRLSSTDGNGVILRGGSTSDDTVAAGTGSGGYTTQDNDWILLEASDDDEPVSVTLTEGNTLVGVTTPNGAGFTHSDMESLNASGNLYGFLDGISTVIGARAYDAYGDAQTAGSTNYGRGSTAQLVIAGSAMPNAIIGGYDNDSIAGDAGDDLLMGGDLQFLIANKNNKNLLDSNGGLNLTNNSVLTINDGKDNIDGGTGNDNIVFESDGGTVTGGTDTAKTSGNNTGGNLGSVDDQPYTGPRFQSQGDTLWLTDFSMGRAGGATLAGEATAQSAALNALTSDATYRMDLGNDGAANFKNYGGANSTSQDQTNYKSVTSNNGSVPRVTTTGMESVNTTGLGRVDYKAAGSNTPDLVFTNQQNYFGLNANVDLRGSGKDNALLANTGSDVLEGRGGDDVISGGLGNDRMLVSFGDGIDWFARPVDANGDNLWDTTGGLVVADSVAWGQDFRPAAAATAGTTTIVVDFGTTILNGVDTFVATFQVRVDGVDYGTTIPVSQLAAAKNTSEVAAIVNPVFQAANKNVSVVATSATTIEVRAVDSTPGDGKLPVIGTSAATGFFVTGQASGTGTYQAKGLILGQDGTNLEDDRLIIKDYTAGFGDRAVNLGADQTKNEINQAAQMVASFGSSSTVAQASAGYTYRLYVNGVREGDKISVDINGTKYEYTTKAGENAEAAAVGLQDVINNALDVHAASGTITAVASATSGGDGFDDTDTVTAGQQNDTNKALVTITQGFANNSATFMDISATVSRSDGVGAFGSVNLHNQTNTMVQLLGFNGSNGALNAQDKDASPVILFQGRQTGTTIADTSSLLLTAKNAGATLNGSDAIADADAAFNQAAYYINGDDLLFGGDGNDTIDGKTGDDRIMMSKGQDKVEGGGNLARPLNSDGTSNGTQVFGDTLQAEERTFGTGTSFKVTLDGAIGSAGAGKGTVAAIKADLTPTGDLTTFTGIETVRVLENNRNSELDAKALSDSIAAAVVTGPNGGIITADERLTIDLNSATPSTKYNIDFNADGDVADSGEALTATAVLGVESVTTGAANDTIKVDHTQLTANNRFTMNGQQDNAVTFVEGSDIVEYDHSLLLPASSRPTLTLAVQGASTGQVKATGGAVGTSVFTDTLTGVEEVTLTLAATGTSAADALDVTALNGGTVNFGAGNVTVGRTLGGQGTPASVAVNEANTLENGGVASSTAALGNELMEVNGITELEIVTGSAGSDRVIPGDGTGLANANFAVAEALTTTTPFNFFGFYTIADRGYTTKATIENYGLYQFNLGAGDDTLDYRSAGDNGIVVVPDFSTNDRDFIVVSSDNDDVYFEAVGGEKDRIDKATGVERYYGASNANTNVIDLSRADAAVTVTFGAESTSNANEVKDPNGYDNLASSPTKTADNQVTGINVSTATNASVARFMESSAHLGTGAALWERIEGSNQNDSVIFSAFQDRNANEALNLRGGNNTVDYSAAVLAGASDAYTLAISDYAPLTTGVTKTHTGITVTHTSTDDAIADVDAITLDRQYSATATAGARTVVDGSLLVIGSSNGNDTVDVSGFGAPTAATGVTGTKFGTTTQVDEVAIWADILGNVGGGYNKVDLGSGAGVTTGAATQDAAQVIVGGETDGAGAASNPVVYDNVVTAIKGFERITGSATSDRLYGNDSDNLILAGAGSDLVMGRGGGDTITLAAGNNRVVYVGSGDTGHINTPAITNLTATGFDSITDFDDTGADLVVVDRAAGWTNLIGNTAAAGAAGVALFSQATGQSTILFTDNDIISSANATNMTAVVAALAASATVGGTIAAGQQVIFALDATDRIGVYVWTASAALDTSISANEVQLLTVLDDADIDVVAGEGAEVFTLADLAMRYGAQSGQQLNQQLVAGVRDEIVYSALGQSQYGAIDSFGTFAAGVLTNPFVAAEDKIDLSGFALAGQGALAINLAIVRDRTGASNQITDANANDFFVDAGGVRRAVVIEFDNDDIDGGAAGVQGRARVFVDINGDGQLSTTQDLFLDFATQGVVVTGTLANGAGNNGVPGFSDLIFGS